MSRLDLDDIIKAIIHEHVGGYGDVPSEEWANYIDSEDFDVSEEKQQIKDLFMGIIEGAMIDSTSREILRQKILEEL